MVMVKKEKRKERGVFVTKASNGYGLTFLVDNLRYLSRRLLLLHLS